MVALAAATALFSSHRRESGSGGEIAGEVAVAVPVVERTGKDTPPHQPRDRAQIPLASLPAPEAPLGQILPGLRSAADGGDRRAACRLGMELLRCQHLGRWEAMTEDFMGEQAEAAFAAEGNLAAANQVAEERLWHIERLEQCRAVPADLQAQGARYLRQSALAGDPYAMLAYAEGHHWGPNMRGMALDPMFDQWRREAPAMIHAALRAGNPSAAFILQINYGDDIGFLSALIPNDAYRRYTYHLLSVRLFGQREQPAYARALDATEIERARREADALHARHFDRRRFPSSQMMAYPPYLRGPQGEATPFCETAP